MAAQAPGSRYTSPLAMAPTSSSSSSSYGGAARTEDDDDDDDDDDADVWVTKPPGTKAGSKRSRAAAAASVPRNVLELGALYDDLGDLPAHVRLQSDFVLKTTKKHQAQLGTTFRIAQNHTSAKKLAAGRGHLQINCNYDGTKARKECTCNFGLSASVKAGSAKITRIGLVHNANCLVFSRGGRRNGAKTSLLALDTTSSWASSLHYGGVAGLHGGLGGVLQRGVAKHDGILMNIAQASRYARRQRNVTLEQSILNMTLLAPFLLACKKADPKGVYLLGTKQGTYTLDGIDAATMREFEWAIIIPSYMIKFWEASDARIMCIDMAHRHAFFGGAQFSGVTKDGYGCNHRLALGFCASENKEAWIRALNVFAEVFKGVKMYMSDKDKGLESTRQSANMEAAQRAGAQEGAGVDGVEEGEPAPFLALWLTIFALCCIHGLANCGTTSAQAREVVAKWARAGTHQEQAHHLEKLRQVAGDAVADKVQQRWKDMSFLGYMELGAETNMGTVSSNAVEQQFSKDGEMRAVDPYLATKMYLDNSIEALTQLGLKLARDKQTFNGHAEIVPAVGDAVVERAKVKRAKWQTRLLGVAGEAQDELTFKVWNDSADYKVILRAGDRPRGPQEPFELPLAEGEEMRWHQRGVCGCYHTRGRGHPCDHVGQCLVFLGHHVGLYNSAHRADGRLLVAPPKMWYIYLKKWYHPESHLDRIARSIEGIRAVVPATGDLTGVQLVFWNIKQHSKRKVRRMHKGEARRAPTGHGAGTNGDGGAGSELPMPEGWGNAEDGLNKETDENNAGGNEQKKGAVKKCSGCGQVGHDSRTCVDKEPYLMIANSGLVKRLAKLRRLPPQTWDALQTLPGAPAYDGDGDGDSLDFDDIPPPPSPGFTDEGMHAYRGHVTGMTLRAWFDLQESVRRTLDAENAFVPFAGAAHDADGNDVNRPEDSGSNWASSDDEQDVSGSPDRSRARLYGPANGGGDAAVVRADGAAMLAVFHGLAPAGAPVR